MSNHLKDQTAYHGSRLADATESTPLLLRAQTSCDEDCPTENANEKTIFWQELRTITRYAIPVLISQLLEFSLVIIEVVSVGHISTPALAAISIGSMTASVTGFGILYGLTSALDTLLPTTFTSSEPHLCGLWAQRMTVVVIVALAPILGVWLNAEEILLALKQSPDIAKLAALYLRWLSFGIPAFGFNCIARRYLQAQGLFGIQTQINLIVAPVNVLLNYLLVWGPPSVRLGFIGAPIASSLSFTLVSVLSVVYGVYFTPKTAWHPISRKMFTNLGPILRLGLAGIGQIASEWWAWELAGLAASYINPLSLATQSVLLTSTSTTYQVGFALSTTATIRVGNLLGEKNAKRAKGAATASIVLALVVSSIISGIYIIFRDSWAYIFTNDLEVSALVSSIIPLVALYQIVDSNAAVTAAILRAKGQQFIGAILNISAYYIIGLPLGVFFAFRLHMGLHGVWTGLAIALTYCAIIGTVLFYITDWDAEVARVIERIAEEDRIQKDDEENTSEVVSPQA